MLEVMIKKRCVKFMKSLLVSLELVTRFGIVMLWICCGMLWSYLWWFEVFVYDFGIADGKLEKCCINSVKK
ncbi:unnamed protein product [Blepharisma stoltei]|uniref:Transmembrane protein n=1 Tax=Blepharisma stoltei TaxID=1481888 RepID=A0AAU9INT9_9CILI|nr:unnamed protein product [Blepharisma stoltei]